MKYMQHINYKIFPKTYSLKMETALENGNEYIIYFSVITGLLVIWLLSKTFQSSTTSQVPSDGKFFLFPIYLRCFNNNNNVCFTGVCL